MTQFDLLKAGYRQLIERGEMTAEEVAAKIRVLDFLASCSKDEIVDSAVLSDIIKGYTQKACNAAGLSDAQTENVLVALDSVLDSVSAKDVVK